MSVEDILGLSIIVFIFVLMTFIFYQVYHQAAPMLDKSLNSTYATAALNKGTAALNILDGLFATLVMGLGLFAVISAFFIRSHPIFFFASLIMFSIVLFLGAVFSNVFQEVSNVPSLADSKEQFTVMVLIMNNLPIVLLGFGALIILALYIKFQAGI